MEYLVLSLGVLFLGALFSLISKEKYKLKVCSIFSLIGLLTALFPAGYVLYTGKALESFFYGSALFGNVIMRMDALSAIFVFIIAVMGLLAVVYANGYLVPYLEKQKSISSHCFFFMGLLASMLAVVSVQHSLFFLIVWELMSLSSFFLVIFEGEKKDVLKSGIKYLIYMHLSVVFIIAMMALLVNKTGSFNFADYVSYLAANSQFANLVFLLGFIGFGIKAGFVPFHNWLPDAHPAAPTHVSGIMSAVMIKTGIYGILRTLYFVGTPSKTISYTVLVIAIISLLYGILYALSQNDFKKLLAYSSIENIGIIGLGISVGMLGLAYSNPVLSIFGFAGGILHILNHSIFKELLFFAAGSVYLKTHTRDMENLGGLIKKMPYTGLLFIIGSIAICGLPPFNGFISEFLIYAGLLLGIPATEIGLFLTLVVSIAALAVVGTMAMLCFTKASGTIFLGEPRSNIAENTDADVSAFMLAPMTILALFAFFIGIFPQYVIKFILVPTSLFVKGNFVSDIFNSVVSLVQTLSWFFFIFLLMTIACLVARIFINKRYKEHVTWGCGYDKPNPRMQYTASSYANLFVSTLKPLFKRVSHVKKPKELFPKEAYYEQEIEDIEEAYIVKPLIKWDEKILTKFERIQNGNIQQYILFGLVFLVIAIIGVICIG